jgi:PPK2 family polyphosphate:nucleotide phosphotransferase
MIDTDQHRVEPGSRVNLKKIPTEVDGGLERDQAEEQLARWQERLFDLQELLYADRRFALLVVLQAMDAGGKDSTIRTVFGHINPQGCQIANFKAPNSNELAHDYLWRVHRETPAHGTIRIFNRSHYEDVLIVRVKKLAPEKVWRRRFDHLNAFERLLHDEGTRVVKFYLHISKAYQKKRFERRLSRADKHWKFNPADLKERARWEEYRKAYEDVLEKCSTEHAPWYIIPAEKRWYRNFVISRVVMDILESMNLRYPEPDFDPETMEIE